MRRMTIGVCLLAVLTAGTVSAQQPNRTAGDRHDQSQSRIAVGELQPTPEMWFYEQYQQQQDDPAEGVYAKAQLRAAQRQGRLASMRWYGLSNSRPRASSDPFHGEYSPKWSASGRYPDRWMGGSTPLVVIRSESSRTR